MSVITKKGDSGTTGILGGGREDKDSARIIAIGAVDELNCALGVLLAENLPDGIRADMKKIQAACFAAGSNFASPAPDETLPKVGADIIELLEKRVADWEQTLPKQTRFILPGGARAAALAFWARAVCRRAEQAAVRFKKSNPFDDNILRFLNRLSDYLFILGRFLNWSAGEEEVEWKG